MKSLNEHSAQNTARVGYGMMVDPALGFVYGRAIIFSDNRPNEGFQISWTHLTG